MNPIFGYSTAVSRIVFGVLAILLTLGCGGMRQPSQAAQPTATTFPTTIEVAEAAQPLESSFHLHSVPFPSATFEEYPAPIVDFTPPPPPPAMTPLESYPRPVVGPGTVVPTPTPVVTPIPTAALPILPELAGRVPAPFWMYTARGNELWHVNSQGAERQLLLNTEAAIGRWLTDVPEPLRGGNCCWGPSVAVSPNGQRIALVTLPTTETYAAGEAMVYALHWFDLATKTLAFVGEGFYPVWSSDSSQIAFQQRNGGETSLWIATLETGEIQQVAVVTQENPIIEEVAWSPDSSQVALLYSPDALSAPVLRLVARDGTTPPRDLATLPLERNPRSLFWARNGQAIFLLLRDDRFDKSSPYLGHGLWSVSATTGAPMPLTEALRVGQAHLSLDKQWLAFVGYALWESETTPNDLWLLHVDGTDLRRVTFQQSVGGGVLGWNPDGTQVVLWEWHYENGDDFASMHREVHSLRLLSLTDGALAEIPLAEGERFVGIGP